MGAGSGGFYAAKPFLDQAANAAKDARVPADILGPTIQIFAFVVMVAMLGMPGLVIGSILFVIVLLGTVQGTVMTLLPQYRTRMRILLVTAYAFGLVPAYLAIHWLLMRLGLENGTSHVLASSLGYCAAFGCLTLAKMKLWKHFDSKAVGLWSSIDNQQQFEGGGSK